MLLKRDVIPSVKGQRTEIFINPLMFFYEKYLIRILNFCKIFGVFYTFSLLKDSLYSANYFVFRCLPIWKISNITSGELGTALYPGRLKSIRPSFLRTAYILKTKLGIALKEGDQEHFQNYTKESLWR